MHIGWISLDHNHDNGDVYMVILFLIDIFSAVFVDDDEIEFDELCVK